MQNFRIASALKQMARTGPFAGVCIAVYCGMGAGCMLAVHAAAAAGARLAPADGGSVAALMCAFLGFCLFALFVYGSRGWILYRVRTPHVAAMAAVMDARPGGRIRRDRIRLAAYRTLPDARHLVYFDQRIRGVADTIDRSTRGRWSRRPWHGVLRATGVFPRLTEHLVVTVVLAHVIRSESSNPWRVAADWCVRYAGRPGALPRHAAWLAITVQWISVLVFALALAAGYREAGVMPWPAGAIVFALLVAWCVRQALLVPLAGLCLMQAAAQMPADPVPDGEWEARLEQISADFRALKACAVGACPPAGRRHGMRMNFSIDNAYGTGAGQPAGGRLKTGHDYISRAYGR